MNEKEAAIEQYMTNLVEKLGGLADLNETAHWPISRYVGHPHGQWEYVETFFGSKREAYRRAANLQFDDLPNAYCLWDQRDSD